MHSTIDGLFECQFKCWLYRSGLLSDPYIFNLTRLYQSLGLDRAASPKVKGVDTRLVQHEQLIATNSQLLGSLHKRMRQRAQKGFLHNVENAQRDVGGSARCQVQQPTTCLKRSPRRRAGIRKRGRSEQVAIGHFILVNPQVPVQSFIEFC